MRDGPLTERDPDVRRFAAEADVEAALLRLEEHATKAQVLYFLEGVVERRHEELAGRPE
jgi:hypothetical protein